MRQLHAVRGQMDHFPTLILPVSNGFPPWFAGLDGEVSAELLSNFPDSSFNRLILPIGYDYAVSAERASCETDMSRNPRIPEEPVPEAEHNKPSHGCERVSRANTLNRRTAQYRVSTRDTWEYGF